LNIEGNFYNVAYGINTTWFFYVRQATLCSAA
jgi:hypothetical protein